jgi:hypothetical protein
MSGDHHAVDLALSREQRLPQPSVGGLGFGKGGLGSLDARHQGADGRSTGRVATL